MPARSMRSSALSTLALTLVALATLVSAPAHAQGAHTGGGSHTGGGIATPPRDTFSEAYTEASRAWHEGRYEDALSQFRALHRSSGRDELLYDIGITADRLGRLEEAFTALEQYLARVPQAHNRAEVEQRIASLREDLREQQLVESAVAPPDRRTSPSRTEGPVMTLQGPPASASPAARAAIAQPPPQAHAEEPREIVTGGGPEWIATWPLLVLTIGAAIAAPVAWDQGFQAIAHLENTCAPCTEEEIASSDAKNWELATNVLLVSALVLGATTLIVFLVEGLSGSRTTVVRRAQREGLDLRVGLGAAGLEGWF